MVIKFLWGIILLIILAQCKQDRNNEVVIESQRLFDSIPSASGVAIKNDTAFIVCDDGTAIYQVNLTNFQQNKISLRGLSINEYREPKPIKHDFESACFVKWQGKEYLMALGSGSNSGSRDSLLTVNTLDHNDQKIISLHEFYMHLQLLTRTDSTEWNIEAVTVVDTNIVIANRGNNLLMVFNAHEMISYFLESGKPFPTINYFRIKLPLIGKFEAKLSGLCTLDQTHLLFCASVEDTPDWTKDGPVLGSYFGICSLKEQQLKATYLLKGKHGEPLKEKIESVDVLKKTNNDELVFMAVGDNDNGSSKLWQLKLRYKD
jgi:hypothetical protein